MEISFCSDKMKMAMNGEVNGSYSILKKQIQKDKAKCKLEDIIMAYEVLKAAKTIKDIPRSYRFHGLSGNHNNEYAIKIDAKYRILFKIIDESIERNDLLNANKIKITKVGLDYH